MVITSPEKPMELSLFQKELIIEPLDSHLWVSGPAGCGKTTAAAMRLLSMVKQGIPADEILILLPQRTLAQPYSSMLASPEFPPGGRPDILTLNGLAQRSISLFWPLVSASAGFKQPNKPPVFLTMETAQYYMSKIVNPLLQQGYFGAVTLTPNRLYSQLLDNLNKSALVGFPYPEIAVRLKSAWSGASSQLRVYDQAQEAIHLFRQFCLDNNLLDFSLQLDVFSKHLWSAFLCRQVLTTQYRHVIFDNLEEDTPVSHDLLIDWLPQLKSALFIMDADAGYRKFLGADPVSALRLKDLCPKKIEFHETISLPAELHTFQTVFSGVLGQKPVDAFNSLPVSDLPDDLTILQHIKPVAARFFPQMLDKAAEEVSRLVNEEGILPDQIAILAPFLSDRLRFGLTQRLSRLDISSRVLRPSRSLQEDSFTGCLLTLVRLAHLGWGLDFVKADLISMLNTAINGLDLCRAGLLADVVYRRAGNKVSLGDFSIVNTAMKDRVTYLAGERYEQLRQWINFYTSDEPVSLDIFFSRVFGELLTQPGFGFHNQVAAGEITANLMESARKFRQAAQATMQPHEIAREFVQAVESGLVSAQYLRSWQEPAQPSVTIAPAFTFLLQNRPVAMQIWLDAGSNAWFERLEQPLTHPYVLNRQWQEGAIWDDSLEFNSNQQTLAQLATGLIRRCTRQIILMYSELNEQGFEQQGVLIKSVFTTFKRIRKLVLNSQQPADSGEKNHV
jgi:hypothetical protein